MSLTDIDEDFAQRIASKEVELVALGKRRGHALDIYPAMWRLLRRLRPAIVHTRNLAALEMTPVAWAAGVPARVHGEHGRDAVDPDGRNLRRQRIRRLYRPFVTHYVALSPDLEAYLKGVDRRACAPHRADLQRRGHVALRRCATTASRSMTARSAMRRIG